jgi:hypothetical protein
VQRPVYRERMLASVLRLGAWTFPAVVVTVDKRFPLTRNADVVPLGAF